MYLTSRASFEFNGYSSNNDSSDPLISPGRDGHIPISSESQEIQNNSLKPSRRIREQKRGQGNETLLDSEMTREISHKEWISRFRALDMLDKLISDAERSDRSAVLVDVEDLIELREEFEFLHKGVTELSRLADDVKQVTIAAKQFAGSRAKELKKGEASKMLINPKSRFSS
ncbi:15412_t:CDS:2 [Acaulospora colombiana]|uniref:15412_t:CDS:1 n=1 Tax=Acaulospora colombiana TaxID=27376 RepID=A0ACA9K1N1_9GLOM|nr:15412_t:CDS:2 [Acaulospora colombiana]